VVDASSAFQEGISKVLVETHRSMEISDEAMCMYASEARVLFSNRRNGSGVVALGARPQ